MIKFKRRYKSTIINHNRPGEKLHVYVIARSRASAHYHLTTWIEKNLNHASRHVFIDCIELKGGWKPFAKIGVEE